jgi:hypothetical protein
MNNFEKLKNMSIEDFANKICFDDEGNQIGSCHICIYKGDCCDLCYTGVTEWLKKDE